MSEGKKKKTRNPSILDWIIDGINYWSRRFEESRQEKLKDAIYVGPLAKDREVAGVDVASVVGEAAAYEMPGKPLGLKTFHKKLSDEAAAVNASHVAAAIAMVAAEVASVGQLDYTLTEFMDLPWMQAMRNMARSTWESEFTYGCQPLLQRHWNTRYTPLLPGARDLVDLRVKGALTGEKYKSWMSESGLADEIAETMYAAGFRSPGVEAGLELLRRGEISTETFTSWGRLDRLSAEMLTKLQELRWVMPSADDLIRFAVREAFPVAPTWEAQYAEAKKYGENVGLTPFWFDRYAAAHWIRMDVDSAFRAMARDPKLDTDWFLRFLRIADIHPDDREHSLRARWRLPGIRAVRHAYITGVIGRERVETWTKWEGTHPDWLDVEVDGLIAYAWEAERNALRRAAYRQLRDGFIPEAKMTEKFGVAGKQDKIITLYKSRAEEERIGTYTEQKVDALRTAAIAGRISLDEHKKRLKGLKMADWRIAHEAELIELRTGAAAERLLTRSEILRAFKSRVRDRPWAERRLFGMNIAKDDVQVLLELNAPIVAPPPHKDGADLQLTISADYQAVVSDLIEFYEREGYDVSEARERLDTGISSLERARTRFDEELYSESLEWSRDAESLFKRARTSVLAAKLIPPPPPPLGADTAEVQLKISTQYKALTSDLLDRYADQGYDISEALEWWGQGDSSLLKARGAYEDARYSEALEFARDAESMFKRARTKVVTAEKA